MSRRALSYTDGSDETNDRPAHVRAGSGLAWFDGKLAAVQDDANFIALVAPDFGRVEFVTLPWGHERRRLFDDTLGNKRFKMDLEACFSTDDGASLYAFGSGATSFREKIVILNAPREREDAAVHVVDASSLYRALRSTRVFAGDELNIEGATLVQGNALRLFQRGVGLSSGDASSRVNASVDVEWSAVRTYLDNDGRSPAPRLDRITQYDLGAVSGVRLAFTDVAEAPGGSILYLACAEDTLDAIRDGDVLGAAVGVIGRDGNVRWAALTSAVGSPLLKPEGLALDPANPRRAFVVVDSDQPDVPSELLEIALDGPWL